MAGAQGTHVSVWVGGKRKRSETSALPVLHRHSCALQWLLCREFAFACSDCYASGYLLIQQEPGIIS